MAHGVQSMTVGGRPLTNSFSFQYRLFTSTHLPTLASIFPHIRPDVAALFLSCRSPDA